MGYHSSPKFSMASMHRSVQVKNPNKPFSSPHKVQVTHSMPPHKIEIFKSMENWAEENVLIYLKPVEKCWQPQDFLPDPASDGFMRASPSSWQLGQGHGPLKRTGTVTFLVSLSVWKSRHETHREDDPVFDWGWNGWADGKQSVPFIHLYFISRKGNFISHGNTARLTKQHGDKTWLKQHEEENHHAGLLMMANSLCERWSVEKLTGLSSEGKNARDYVWVSLKIEKAGGESSRKG
ncbi:Stearoyl-[acyl-carrier-protein] 9-desaturase, chloroplastic [Vitis vinifera]|uniref:Stearoyl-[acyl-carrier-protein] 9-desaturase, chloroplastic n=1 Tax=Vitis vinifera TaxID=29760 RepID=A0A438CNS2_VITVI|nr:Stearoyl-[acyl-carrier-protein] 9-desaturase, chloroplastic [Vitis vinifera]